MQGCGSRSDTEDYLFGTDGSISLGATAGSAGRGAGAANSGGRGSGAAGGSSRAGSAATGGRSSGGTAAIAGSSAVAGQAGFGGAGAGGAAGSGGTVAGSAGVVGVAGGPAHAITCGGESCDGASQSCCLEGGLHCITQGEACSGPVLACTSHSDCDGELCCLSLTGDAAQASACKPSCNNMGSGRDRQLCDTDADCRPPFRYCRGTVFGLNLCVFRP